MDDLTRLTLPIETGALQLLPGRVALLNARPGPGLAAFPDLVCEQGLKPLHDALAGAGIPVIPLLEETGFAAAAVLQARNRSQTLGLIARAAGMVVPGGLVLISGSKLDGIDATLARLRGLVALESFAKGHGKTAWFTAPDPLPEAFGTWREEAALRRNTEGLFSAPGMFSHAHADPGSRHLADALAGRLSGRVAELGAGYGWLARRLLQENPDIAALTLFEADHAALGAARINVTDARARFDWADVTRLGREAGPFDAVVSNPPFHAGRRAEPELGTRFIEAASRLLDRKGTAHFVANRHLPYERVLELCFARLEVADRPTGYKILTAGHPRSDSPRRQRK